ncbi:ubiquitin carboxyl-terminal hydrolase BAP1-like [Macrosteles quadrilineatus]|uniref:ubiquitin carboxyl-terminal hydrolase BAP1-like n=1 Tax=Macrosteles quadrilineatus TaxID=74068 RepID=UPI0023E15281|nr:ubiquitin carboxyl-terminal hydrolase BAP1-like [Macrosteles quadrilineatus]
MPNINCLTESWLELESDPGLFTLLLEDFGVKGVEVEEIYDLQKSVDSPVYGFIFLFRWIEERRSKRRGVKNDTYVKDEDLVNTIFFAKQMIPNSCATHALVSILMNCDNIHLGSTLSRLKSHTHGMSPENKGWAIGNTPELARAHNSHAIPEANRLKQCTGTSTGRFTAEAYHFISYVPINGRLFELDGLKPYPMDHGSWNEGENWTDKFQRVIADRIGIAGGDICFNLMAMVPDQRIAISSKLNMLNANRLILLEALQQLVKLNHPDLAVQLEKESKGKSDETKVSLGSKRKKSKIDSLASIEDVLAPGTPNKIARKQHLTEHKEEKAEKSEDTDENLKASPANWCECLERHNLSKISLIVTMEEKEQIKFQIPETSKTGEKIPDSTPLAIHTSPVPSTSSTDPSSVVGSAFNSTTQSWSWKPGQSSPNNAMDFKKIVVIRVATAASKENVDSPTRSNQDSLGICKVCLKVGILPKNWEKTLSEKVSGMEISSLALSHKLQSDESCNKIETAHHTFAPKDLLALLENFEEEIRICEGHLKDENEKRERYKVDDSRRTHNYDVFICTFLSMLAEQGKLADLIEQNLNLQKKPGITQPRPSVVKQTAKKPEATQKKPEATQKKTKASSKNPEATQKKTKATPKIPEASQKKTKATPMNPEATQKKTKATPKNPEATQKQTKATPKNPEATQKKTKATQKNPEATQKNPEATQNKTKATQKNPEATQKKTKATPKNPEATQKKTKATQKNPEATQKNPEATQKKTKATQKNPEATQKNPEATQNKTKATQKNPEVTQKNPEATQKKTKATQKNPEATQKNPEATQKKTKATQKNPEATQKKTKATQKNPEATQKKTKATQKNPEATQKNPEATQNKTKATQKNPEATQNKTKATQKKIKVTQKTNEVTAKKRKLMPKKHNLE